MKNAQELMEALLSGENVDLYEQDPNDWSFLSEIIPDLVVTSAGGMLPFQASGTLKDLPFYFRARHEWASLHLSAPGDDPAGFKLLYTASEEAPFNFGPQEFCAYMVKLVPQLKKSPFRWDFEGYKLSFPDPSSWESVVRSEEKQIYVGWGATPEEGWAKTQEISEYLLEHGCPEELQKKHLELKAISKTPLNWDDRFFPEADLVFEVNLPKQS